MKYLSLFSGVGGFEVGIENSDVEMECIGFSEVDKNAKSIYRRHFPDHKDLGDATKIRPEELPDFDLLVAGFPCQPFSNAGTRGGLDDTRGTMFFEIARICQEKRPQYLLLENVLGLLSNDKGRTFQKFLGILTEMGYFIQWEVRNSKNYGVPQNRERVFIKGYLRGRGRSEVLRVREDQREASAECEQVEIARPVLRRKHDCDITELKKTLRDAKKKSNYSVVKIAEHFGLPKTHVEHWFRRDNSFAIPNAEYWNELKDLIEIDTNEFDAFVTEFEIVEGVYEKSKRAYLEHGLAPTITSSGGEIVGVQRENPGVDVVVPGKQATRVMSPDGVSVTLCGNAGGLGGKTGLYAIPKAVANYSERNHGAAKVYDTNGISPTLTATNYKHPITIAEEDKVCKPVLTPDRVNKRQNGRRMKEDGEPMFTLTAQDKHGVFDGYDFRRLTPLETERLQAFPDGWTELGENDEVISDTQRYRCTGNAVTTSVITYVINEMFGDLND
ncbi:DNA (cytosine-5-)-methyltransferase [uncultured Methanobrevibacter sp.]|uniref:DNA (cytosine-5-)-methyltransferase n=1 Tax=uncultured Methanobrevibacter sp. TaxID=253161 RepID=UPI0025F99DF9|nr:DNA (cytosine-5-)-methyltransferase [uncultured Methanobrevibacter sp.]